MAENKETPEQEKIVSRSLLAQARQQMALFAFDDARATLAPLAELAGEPPRDEAAYFWRDAAEVLRDAGMAQATEKAWGRAKREGVAPHAAEIEIATGYVLAGRFDEALERLTTLVTELPRNAVVRNLNAIALFECGRHEAALADWEVCRKISTQRDCPLSTHPFYLSLGAMAVEGYLARNSGGNVPSPESYEPTISRAPGGSQAKRMEQIEKAWEDCRYAEALSWIETEIQSEKEPNEEIHMIRALILGGMGRWADAREEVTKVLQNSATNPSAQSYYAYCLINSGKAAIALPLLDRIPSAGPDDYFVNYIRGCGWLALGDRPRAAQAFRVAFSEYFFDTYHSVLLPAWKRMLHQLKEETKMNPGGFCLLTWGAWDIPQNPGGTLRRGAGIRARCLCHCKTPQKP